MNEDTIDAASEITTIFEALDVPYMIGGSVASTLWGEPRFALNVDFVAALKSVHVALLVKALGTGWYADEGAIQSAVTRRALQSSLS